MRVLGHVVRTIRDAAVYNPDSQVAPACILWPDKEHQWKDVIERLQADMPELLVLEDYAPERRMGPAIWLRCVIAGYAQDAKVPTGLTPIVYLPGVSRQDLRAVESCPDHLKPLAELQYRGVIWSQANAKDWTILAYLKSNQGGLGLDVVQDNETKRSMQLAITRLLDEDLAMLQGKHLNNDYFNTLLTGRDPVRDLLQWLDMGDEFKSNRGANEWKAFVDVCKSQYAFNPQLDGSLTGAYHLATREGPWASVWQRYCEAPKRYPNIPKLIRQCKPPAFDLFDNVDSVGGWPQWNDEQEQTLRHDLLGLANVPQHEARKRLLELEINHSQRRNVVWAELGDAPLACALEHLAVIAEITQKGLTAGSVADLTAGYSTNGWRADDAVLRALAQVERSGDLDVVITVIRAVYLPWLENSARYLQKLIEAVSYPGETCRTAQSAQFAEGDCVLFVDGLRFDAGKRLHSSLIGCGLTVTEEPTWAALPSVTATGKAAVTPVRDKISGEDGCADFEPVVATTGQSLRGGYHLKKLLRDSGWSILDRSDNGNGQGMAWCEFGDIDREGHDRGWKLAKHIDTLVYEITDRINELFSAGWKRVRVVTDHGWLLLPGALPKIDLPSVLVDSKWGRCASLKPGATTDERLYPWYWNPNQYFALADGVSCFKSGEEYTHGGLSLQECLTLQLTVTRVSNGSATTTIDITDVAWKGMRCTVAVDGHGEGLVLDIRSQAGDADSSVVLSSKPLKDDGRCSVVVDDDNLQGRQAMIVLINADGTLAAQIPTVIGGDTA